MAHGVVEVKSKVIWWSIDGHGRRKTIARRNRVGKENLQGRESLMACGRFCRGRLLRRALFRLIGRGPYSRRDSAFWGCKRKTPRKRIKPRGSAPNSSHE